MESHTDIQTDSATHFKTAVYDEGITSTGVEFSGQFELLERLPDFVKKLYKQQEICPDTKRLHYQIHVVCHKQQRISALSGWIKFTRWFVVKGDKHIKNSITYTSKTKSAVPGTHEEVEGERYYRFDELLSIVASSELYYTQDQLAAFNHKVLWKHAVNNMLERDLAWINKLCNPLLKTMWDNHHRLFIERAEHVGEADMELPFIIEGEFTEYNFLD